MKYDHIVHKVTPEQKGSFAERLRMVAVQML